MLSAIANAELEGHQLSPEFLDGSWLLIIFAGNDTTRNTLSGAIKLLTENPDQKQKLIDNPDLMPNFLQECIRMISPSCTCAELQLAKRGWGSAHGSW